MVLQHFCEHLLEFRSQYSILFLKNYTVFIDNTDEDTIFVNVKTDTCLIGIQNFGTPSPFNLNTVRQAVMPCPLLSTKIVWGLDFYLNRPKNAGFYLYL